MPLIDWLFYMGLGVTIPGITGLIRFPTLEKKDRPIVWICWFLFLNELAKFLAVKAGYRGNLTYNIGVLFLSLLYLWQFTKWGTFQQLNWLPAAIAALLTLVWMADHFWPLSALHERTRSFRLMFSFGQMVMSIVLIQRLIVTERKSLYNNGRFIITATILIYYLYKVIVDVFSRDYFSQNFRISLAEFNRYLVIAMYIVFAIGMICLPKKKTFFLPS